MTKNDLKTGGVVLWIVLCLSGCATPGDVRTLDKDIQRLDLQMSQIQKENDSIKNEMRKELDGIRAELMGLKKETETNHSAQQTETQKLKADLLLRLETLQSEMRILSTAVGEYKEFLKTPSREISQVKSDVEVRLRILEERAKTSEDRNRAFEERNRSLEERNRVYEERLKGMDERLKGLDAKWTARLTEMEKTIPPKEPPAEPKLPSTTAGSLYKDAYETFQRGDLDGSRRKFEAFLKQYPNMELSDNAQFWVGETYFLKKDFEKAILEYEKVIVKYPEGDKVPSALLKQGLAFLELGDKTNGRNLLRRVVDRFPQTEQADIAKKKLEAIK